MTKTIRCTKCGGTMQTVNKDWHCTNCGNTKPRFLTADTTSPLFLNVHVKKPEDKKFLEDIMQQELEEKKAHREYWKNGILFIKEDGKIVDCQTMTMEQYAERLASAINNKTTDKSDKEIEKFLRMKERMKE